MEGQAPKLFLVPSMVWQTPGSVFVDRNYEGLKSKPEWGLNISRKNMSTLEEYAFETTVEQLLQDANG
jgi:hypothetical protein